jgi:hypothetical protein
MRAQRSGWYVVFRALFCISTLLISHGHVHILTVWMQMDSHGLLVSSRADIADVAPQKLPFARHTDQGDVTSINLVQNVHSQLTMLTLVVMPSESTIFCGCWCFKSLDALASRAGEDSWCMAGLLEVVENVKPSCIIGVSDQGGSFNKQVRAARHAFLPHLSLYSSCRK